MPPRSNRYKGILQPRQLGPPRGESPLLLLYDIEDNRIRARVSQICLDYGLERIQFSAFFGRLTSNLRQELAMKILKEVQKQNARVRLMPVTEESLAEMWEYDHWRVDAERLKAEQEEPGSIAAPDFPRLKVIRIQEY